MLLSIFSACGLAAEIGGNLPKNPAEYDAWEARMSAAVSKYAERSDDEALTKLAGYVFKLSLPRNREREGRPVFTAAVEALISNSDHAAYFERELERLRPLAREGEPTDHFSDERQRLFNTLHEIPSPQVVELLIKCLDDPSGEVRDEHDVVWSQSNQTMAMYTIMRTVEPLPLNRDKWGCYRPDLEALKKWGEQVLDGVRTFRFVGSPQRYNIHGPVGGPDTAPPKRRTSSAGEIPVEARESRGVPWLPLGAAFLVLVVAVGFWLRVRKAA